MRAKANEPRAKHKTVPSPYRFGMTEGTCPTCGKPVYKRQDGIWLHKEETKRG